MTYKFTIPGTPISKSNFKPNGGGFSSASKKKWDELTAYEDTIYNKVSAKMGENGWEMLVGYIQMMVVVYKGSDLGDIQNYPKSICDALEGVLYDNDKNIKILGAFTGGVDKKNPRIVIKASPIESMEYFKVGTLVYAVDDEMRYLMGKKGKEKESKVVDVKLCSTCGLPLFKKKAGNWEFWSCTNDHHYSLGAF